MKRFYKTKELLLLVLIAMVSVFSHFMVIDKLTDSKMSAWVAFVMLLLYIFITAVIYVKNNYKILVCWEFLFFYVVSFIRNIYVLYIAYFKMSDVQFVNNIVFEFSPLVLVVASASALIRLKIKNNQGTVLEQSGDGSVIDKS